MKPMLVTCSCYDKDGHISRHNYRTFYSATKTSNTRRILLSNSALKGHRIIPPPLISCILKREVYKISTVYRIYLQDQCCHVAVMFFSVVIKPRPILILVRLGTSFTSSSFLVHYSPCAVPHALPTLNSGRRKGQILNGRCPTVCNNGNETRLSS